LHHVICIHRDTLIYWIDLEPVGKNVMNTHSKSNNFIAILIAVILFAIGFLLYFIHEQSQSTEQNELGQTKTPSAITNEHSGAPFLS